jgi:hypothetical protein
MKELIIMVSSTWKFAATFPLAILLLNMSFFETILYTNIGGLLGIIIFTVISKVLIKFWDSFWLKKPASRKEPKKVFTWRNRRLIYLKNNFGLPGIVILTPVLLSIPVGVFLITKYFGQKKMSYLYLLAGQITWSFIYTLMYTRVKTVI